ncbi:MAG TPA: hypothetical protein VF331_15055 [Polyangiales bacterium]
MAPGRPLRSLRSQNVARREASGGVMSWLALVLVCGSVAGQLASFAHLALVRHSVCAEHGELIHSDEGGEDHVGAARTLGSGVSRQAVLGVARGAEAAHAHEHCLVITGRRDRTVHRAALTLVGCAGVQQVLAFATQSVAVVATNVFAYAPKCSPPV